MSKYAVIKLNGRQYRVSENEEILVDKLSLAAAGGKTSATDPKAEVLLLVNDSEVKVGKPTVANSAVKLKVLNEEEKGEKVDIFKYKSKSRYRKHLGFRPKYTRLLVEKIS